MQWLQLMAIIHTLRMILALWGVLNMHNRFDRIRWEIWDVVRVRRPKARYEFWQSRQLALDSIEAVWTIEQIDSKSAMNLLLKYETCIYTYIPVCVCAYAIKGPRHNSSQYANVAFNGRIVWTSNPEPGALSSLREQHQQPRWKIQIRMR